VVVKKNSADLMRRKLLNAVIAATRQIRDGDFKQTILSPKACAKGFQIQFHDE
jgi:hypothetical protein